MSFFYSAHDYVSTHKTELTVELKQHLSAVASPNSNGTVLTSSQQVVSVCVYCRNSTAVSVSDLPKTAPLVEHIKASKGSIPVANHHSGVVLGDACAGRWSCSGRLVGPNAFVF